MEDMLMGNKQVINPVCMPPLCNVPQKILALSWSLANVSHYSVATSEEEDPSACDAIEAAGPAVTKLLLATAAGQRQGSPATVFMMLIEVLPACPGSNNAWARTSGGRL